MGTISKSVKLSTQCESGSDRISSLPCAIISHILSFLPTKDAVSTCVLSTKWKHMWQSIPVLILNDDSFSQSSCFTSLVYRLLLQRRGSCLNEFHLDCIYRYDPLDINAWINAALCYNVQQLLVMVALENDSSLCREIYFSTTLVELQISVMFVMNVPMSVCLPRLKIATLVFVQFLDDESLTRFICGCPVLEELTLCKCISEDVNTISIVSPLLNRLVLEDLPHHDSVYFNRSIKSKIVIDTPSLKYLEMKNFFAGGYVIVDLHNLIEAHVAISSNYADLVPSDYAAVSDYAAIAVLLKGISSVQSLHVSWFDIVYIWPEDYFELPEFPKLTYLELIVDMESDFLPEMLENSPCLETLVYKEEYFHTSSIEWKNESRVFDCCSFSKRLKVIEIKVMHGLKCVDNMILFFSKHAKALEKLIVQSESCDDGLQDDLARVTCFLKNKDNRIKKFTLENNASPDLRKWIFDYTR